MSLDVFGSNRSQSVKAGIGFAAWYPRGYESIPKAPYVVHYHDLLLQYLVGGFYFPLGSESLDHLLGLSSGSYLVERTKVSFKPNTYSTPTDQFYDAKTYGSYFRNLQLFSQFLTGEVIRAPKVSNENFTRHRTYLGQLTEKQSFFPIAVNSRYFYDLGYSSHDLNGYLSNQATVSSVLPFAGTLQSAFVGDNLSRNFLDLLAGAHGSTIRNIFLYGGIPAFSTLTNLRYHLSLRELVVDYHMHMVDSSTTYVYDWDSRLEVKFPLPQPDRSVSVGEAVSTTYIGSCRFSYMNFYTSQPLSSDDLGASEDVYDSEGTTFRPFYIFLSAPSSTDVLEKQRIVYTAVGKLLRANALNSFASAVNDSWRDIVPSSVFSAVQAFKASESSLNTNILQDLQKLPGISNALPQIAEAVRVLGRISKRDLSLSTLREILDLATSTHLQASFEWRPFLGLITTYLPQMIASLSTLGHTSRAVRASGSFVFQINDDLTRKKVTLLTRSKIVMDTSSSGLLSAVLGVDALGLLPKASRLWDLLPFTFVVNWFSGIGKSIERAEYSLLLATIPAYFVHSYTFTSPLSADELDSLEMSSSSEDPASLRLYYRDVSLYSPTVRDSRFGFGIPTEMPFVGVMGSLLYQLIFG